MHVRWWVHTHEKHAGGCTRMKITIVRGLGVRTHAWECMHACTLVGAHAWCTRGAWVGFLSDFGFLKTKFCFPRAFRLRTSDFGFLFPRAFLSDFGLLKTKFLFSCQTSDFLFSCQTSCQTFLSDFPVFLSDFPVRLRTSCFPVRLRTSDSCFLGLSCQTSDF